MTVIRPNSISGITSLTAHRGSIDFYAHDGSAATFTNINSNVTSGVSTFASLNITGDLDVGGALTYEDVTNVDSIGVVTARNGIDVTGGTVTITTGANSASPAGSGDNLVIKDSGGCGLSILSGNGNSQNIYLGSVSDNDAVRLEGFYNSGSPYFNIYTGGTERLRITSAGDVGIGVADPDVYSLGGNNRYAAIKATAGYTVLNLVDSNNSGSYLQFGNPTVRRGSLHFDSDSNFLVTINESGSGVTLTEKLRLDLNGRLTISGQGLKLNANTSTLYTLDGSLSYYATNNAVYLNGAGANGWLRLNAAGTENNQNAINIFGSGSGTRIDMRTNNVERLRITSGGNIGINETSPQHKLHVGGDVQIGFNSPTDAARQIIFNSNRGSAGATIANLNWEWNGTTVAQVRGIAGSDTTNKDNAHLAFFTAPSGSLQERLRITSAGNVGLGTNSPNSKMHLMGGNLQIGDFSADGYETKLGNNILTFKRNGTAYVDQIGTGPLTFRFGSSYTSSLTLQNAAECVKVTGTTADTGTSGGSRGLTLQTGGGTSCPLYFGSETNSAQKSMYMTGYWIYLRGHQNEGIRFVFSQGSGNAPRSDQYQFKYNQATRPTGNTTWDGFSDRRAKENVQDVTSALDTIGRLRPVTFDWTNDYADRMNMFNLDKTDPRSYMWTSVKENGYDETRKNNNVGFIAQEFEEVFPKDITETEMELGDETITDFKTVNFDSLVPMLTKAVQELKAENDSLRARLDAAGL